MAQGSAEILVFEVAGQRLGLPAEAVRELLRAVHINPLPRSPEIFEGVINLRGAVVPILDIRRWLGLPAKPVEPSDHLLVVRAGERLAGLRVDRAVELVTLDPGAVERADYRPGDRAGVRVAKFPDGLVLLPDLQTLLVQGEP